MAINILGFSVSNTNSSNSGLSFVRVYNESGEKIAEVGINKRNPLAYVRQHKASKYKISLREQCIKAGMCENIFYSIFGEVCA